MDKKLVKIGNSEYKVEIASSPFEKMKGMRFRREGKMLFIFDREVREGLHMATLSVPLQMIFFNSNRKVIGVQKAEPWTFDPETWRIYRPGKSYRYVLETTKFLDVETGERFEFLE